MAFSPDGSRVASGSDDKTLGGWDAQSGNLLAIFAPQDDVLAVWYHPTRPIIHAADRGSATVPSVYALELLRP